MTRRGAQALVNLELTAVAGEVGRTGACEVAAAAGGACARVEALVGRIARVDAGLTIEARVARRAGA